MSPMLVRTLLCLVAAAVYAMDDSLGADELMLRLEGLLAGWALVPRPGDRAKRKGPFPLPGFTLAALLAGCVHAPQAWEDVVWPAAVECSDGVSDAVGEVSQALLRDGPGAPMSDDAKNALARSAAEYGVDTVACLVARLVDDWSTPGATANAVVASAARRGRAFLSEVAAQPSEPPGGW